MTAEEAIAKALDILPKKILEQHVSERAVSEVHRLLAINIMRKANSAVDAAAVEEIMNHGR